MQLSASIEDYLKAVLTLSSQGGSVRITDLARHLSVKPPSAVAAVRQLTRAGLVHHERYGHVELTDQGLKIAREVHNRHQMLVTFLSVLLGLDQGTAEVDACRIEHDLSPQAMGRIMKFLQFLEACPAPEPLCLAAFCHYVATGSLPDSCPQGCWGN